MSKKLTLVLTLVLAVLPGAAYALGLGEIKLNSALNDKFSADIQIVGATSDELDSLDVKLASLAQFSQAGLDHPEVLGQLQFVVVRNPDGSAYVHITSNQGVREPFLDFLIDANWNNGELIREYTVLLNPQSFQTATAAKPEAAATQTPAAATVAAALPPPAVVAPAQVSAAAPAPAQAQAETPAAAQPEAAVAATEQPTTPAPQPAASPPPSPAPTAEPAPAQRALGANYGPIHRGETLSGIAKQVRPDGVTLNQMMVAIYQANPEVFTHNINRMKAGYILRMPTASDAQAVNVTDANAEVRAQMEAWRNNRGVAAAPAESTAASAQPALQLVAPSSAADSSAPVPGADKQGNGEAVASAAKPETTPESSETPASPPPAATPAAPPANQAPLAVKNNALAAVQQQAAQQPAPAVLPPPEAAKNEPLKPAPVVAAKPAPAQESSGGFLDAILNVYVLGALLVVIVLVVLGVVIKKRKKASPSTFNPTGTARIKGADWMKQEQVGGENDNTASSSTTRTRTKAKKASKQIEEDRPEEKTVLVNHAAEVAGGDDSDKTMLMSAPPPMQDTMVGGGGGGGSKLDVSDPMAEADFHMAYGLYDQAADVLRKALRQDPSRHDIQVKLLEVFFTAGDKDNFVGEAKKLRQSMGGAPGKDWESVAIMGRQVAPDEAMFSSSGAPSTAAVDIALGTGGTDTVVSDLGDAFSNSPSPAPAPAPAPAAAQADNLMDFSLPDIEPMPAAPAPEAPKAGGAGGMEFDLGDLNFEPTPAAKAKEEKKAAPTLGTDEPTVATDFGTDSQVEFDKALNDLAAFVNTNVPAQPEMAESANGAGLSMDDAPAPAAGGDEPSVGSSISEIGTKLDLARAYIDMGDPDGAKSILSEVIGEGNAQQKQEAQELLKHVS